MLLPTFNTVVLSFSEFHKLWDRKLNKKRTKKDCEGTDLLSESSTSICAYMEVNMAQFSRTKKMVRFIICIMYAP